MRTQDMLYNAAREGRLPRLRLLLEHRPKQQVSDLVHAKVDGATPLIAACRHGHLPIVEYLVESCRADIEQVGSVRFDGETIEGAPPLWCAAAAGFMNIVKYLIGNGAKVNNTTFTNSTPLRAACFDGHLDIVQYLVANGADYEIANRHGHTCLMIACYKGHYKIVKYLMDQGADVNRKSLKGNTALHDCAESGSLEILKLLISCNASMERDAYNMTPLLAAAVTGHTQVVEYLVSQDDCTRAASIDALELLGATYVDKKRDMIGAIKYWIRAMEERFSDEANVITKPVKLDNIPAYENAREARTMEELRNLISDPDDMRMQALLVRERILGPAHPDTSYYIRYRGAVFADMGNFDRCIVLWMYALDMQQQILEPLSPMTQSSFLSFAELFSFMMTESRNRPPQPVKYTDIMAVFKKAMRELKLGQEVMKKTPATEKDTTNYNRLVLVLVHLTCLLCRMESKMNESEQKEFRREAHKLVMMNPYGPKGRSLLHLACSKDSTTVGRYPVCSFPSAPVVTLLAELGQPLDLFDLEGNQALHVAASNRPCSREVIEALLDCGAHIDARNKDGQLVFDLISGVSLNPLPYQSLQCLVAKVIRAQEVPYKGVVPKRLEPFIEMH